MAILTHHVVPNPDGGWSVRRGGSVRASRTFGKREDAIEYARGVSRNQGSELIIHKPSGAVGRIIEASRGPDPLPPTAKPGKARLAG